MSWWQFSLNCLASELGLVEDLMIERGALSICIGDAGDEPIYEPMPGENPVWRESVVTATFDAKTDPETLYRDLADALPPNLTAGLRRSVLREQDWEQAYRVHFKPLRCAPGLWIVPSWCEPPEPGARIIRLDPGLAFGTGAHATTALCLAWLGVNDITGLRVIDYGCGSGILAIAAIKLGAQKVVAVDIDPQALDATESNARINDIDPARLRICLPGAMDCGPADLLVANILARPLIEFAPLFTSLVAHGGRILLSGVLKSQLEDIQLAYRPCFNLDAARTREQWVCIGGKRI